ncbi:unnamed protein product [Chrysoparadoxa australica]
MSRHGVLLDLDGTLLDTAPDLAGALNDLRRDRGMTPLPLAALRHTASMGGRGMLARGLGLTPDDPDYSGAYTNFLTCYRKRLTDTVQPFPGIRAALAEIAAAGHAWGVVTNKMLALAEPLMTAMAFSPPPACVIGGDSAPRAKPHPDPLLLACEQLGLAPTDCVYVGDSDRDIAAGRAAGMPTIGVLYGYFDGDEDVAGWGADQLITQASELPAAVANLLPTQETHA